MITFLFPTAAELPASLKKAGRLALHQGQGWQALCTGAGPQVVSTMRRYRPQLQGSMLVLLGYGGALLPYLEPGVLVMCKEVRRHGSPPLHAPAASHKLQNFLMRKQLPVQGGVSYTVDSILSDRRQKYLLADKGGTVVDMENYLAAQEASRMGLSLVCLRLILDRADEALPDLMDTLTRQGKVSLTATLGHLCRSPQDMLPMVRIGWRSLAIASHIDQAWHTIMEWRQEDH